MIHCVRHHLCLGGVGCNVCSSCVLWYGVYGVSNKELRTQQTKDNVIQFLLDNDLITKAEALSLTFDYE